MMLRVIPETFLSPEQQLFLFGGSCLLGIPCGMLFDCFRLLRRLIPHHPAAVAAEDILFPVLCGILLTGYTSSFAAGDFRLYYVIGCTAGFVLYECTLGRIVISIGEVFCRLLRLPFRMLGACFAFICRKGTTRFVKNPQNEKNRQKMYQNHLQDAPEIVYNKNSMKKKVETYGKAQE